MDAQALICDDQQNFSLEVVELKDPTDKQISIRTQYTGVSIGTEFALIRNKISWGTYPLCTGYMGTGIVESVGKEIDEFFVGDKVYFRGNDSMKLVNGTDVCCVSGAHCSHIVLDPNTNHGAAKLPQRISMETASMFVMPAVALYGWTCQIHGWDNCGSTWYRINWYGSYCRLCSPWLPSSGR